MIDRSSYNLVLAEICSAISENTMPSDESFIKYKEIFYSANIVEGYEMLYSFHLLKHVDSLLLHLKKIYTENEIIILIESFLEKVNTIIHPLNFEFFSKYFKCRLLEGNKVVTLAEKILLVENCINENPINNVLYELNYYTYLLNLYLGDVSTYILNVKETSAKVKDLLAITNNLPKDLINL